MKLLAITWEAEERLWRNPPRRPLLSANYSGKSPKMCQDQSEAGKRKQERAAAFVCLVR